MSRFLSFVKLLIILMTVCVPAADIGLDIKSGLNLTSLDGYTYDNLYCSAEKKVLNGFVGGLGIQIGLNKWFAVQPEMLFSSKGVKVTEEFADESFSEISKLTYLSLPVLFKFRIPVKKVRFNISAGPEFSFNLSSEHEWLFDESKYGRTQDSRDCKDETSSFDFGAAMGCGMEFIFGFGRLLTDFRYTHGFINTDQLSLTLNDFEGKNRVFSAMFGLGFDFK